MFQECSSFFSLSFLWYSEYRNCPDTVRAMPHPASLPCLIPSNYCSRTEIFSIPCLSPSKLTVCSLMCVCMCVCVYTYVWGSLLIPYWDGEHFGSLVYFSTGLFQSFLPFVSILLRKRGDLAKPELNSPLCTPIKRMQSIIWERKRTYSFGYRLHSVWGAGGREAET